ncbi:MAG: phage tail protein, partial [Lentisphaeria bacterium]|nr:phage tail protein [Lentisphaeria bacterium]
PEGSEVAGTVKNAGLPNILGRTNTLLYDKNMDGALYDPAWSSKGFNWDNGVTSENGYVGQMGFDASRSNPIYGSSDTVQPPALTMRFFIKY